MVRHPSVPALHPADRAELERWRGSSSVRPRLAQRAHIVLLAADGVSTQEIADRVGVSRPTVSLWRTRYASSGPRGLEDRDRPGRPSQTSETMIITSSPAPTGSFDAAAAGTGSARSAAATPQLTPPSDIEGHQSGSIDTVGRTPGPGSDDAGRVEHPRTVRDDPLLQTKLTPLGAQRSVVPRQRLGALIEEGLTRAVLLVSAPAGFGKSTLVSSWLADRPAVGPSAAWLSLSPADNDPTVFWRYVLAALSGQHPGLGTTASALLGSPQAPPITTILTIVINAIHAADADVVLVLDDYHLIDADAIHQAMTFILDNRPPRLHLIIITRADPALPLSRLRASGELLELRASDLRFAAAEAETYLNQIMGLRLSAADVAELLNRTEGWVAGLQMAALAIRDHTNAAEFIAGFTGSNRYVIDYLADEVLARQPDELRAFLLETSVLDRMCASLCNDVTSRHDSQDLLEALEHANLFITPLDEVRGWYRYHQLFADVLHQRLGQQHPHRVAELHRRASTWYEDRGLLTEAVRHALRGGDVDRTVRLIEAGGMSLVLDQQVHTVLGWLDELPATKVRTRPGLATLRALGHVFTNRPDQAEASLHDAEGCLSREAATDETRALLGRVAVIRAAIARFCGDVERSASLGRRALQLLPETTATAALRGSAHAHAALTYQVSGDVNPRNERSLEQAITAFSSAHALVPLLNAINRLGKFQTMQGQLRAAHATYQRAADAVAEHYGHTAVNSSAYYAGMGEIHLQWNDLDTAHHFLHQAVGLVTTGLTVDAVTVADGYLSLARLHQAQGRPVDARDTLSKFADLARRRGFFTPLAERGEAEAARLALRQHDLATAVRWAEGTDCGTADDYSHEVQHLTVARIRLARGHGDGLTRALTLLDQMSIAASQAGRIDSLIEVLALRAMVQQAQGWRSSAVETLGRAVALAEPEGYVRVFVDEGPPMAALLNDLVQSLRTTPRHARPDASLRYARQLLTQFGPHHDRGGPSVKPGPQLARRPRDPLTGREREVLQLIADGLSNQEVAARLYVATSTVKSYTNHIYRKLCVESRTQAIAEARALHLLSD